MKKNYNKKIAITTGDINGIGAEITIKALNSLSLNEDEVVIISDKNHIKSFNLNKNYEIIDIPYRGKIEYGKTTKESGDFAFNCLKKACEITPKAIVTAPVSKSSLNLAGHKYNGQTEVLEYFLAHDGQKAEMLFVSKYFDVLLLTRHCALKDIKITENIILDKVLRLYKFYKKYYNKTPKFALCSLNPHAGEDGLLGTEEISIIIPAIEKLRNKIHLLIIFLIVN